MNKEPVTELTDNQDVSYHPLFSQQVKVSSQFLTQQNIFDSPGTGFCPGCALAPLAQKNNRAHKKTQIDRPEGAQNFSK